MGDFWDESVVRTAVAKNIATPEGVEHPTPFPEQIVTLPILQTTDEGTSFLTRLWIRNHRKGCE